MSFSVSKRMSISIFKKYRLIIFQKWCFSLYSHQWCELLLPHPCLQWMSSHSLNSSIGIVKMMPFKFPYYIKDGVLFFTYSLLAYFFCSIKYSFPSYNQFLLGSLSSQWIYEPFLSPWTAAGFSPPLCTRFICGIIVSNLYLLSFPTPKHCR